MKARIGMFGHGNVGQGVAQIIVESKQQILQKSGIELELAGVCVRDATKPGNQNTQGYRIITNRDILLDDPSINVIVEVIGGTTDARDIVYSAIGRGKNVVTANKALLAEYGDDIFRFARGNEVTVNYEASVAGSIPIIQALRSSLVTDNISRLYGIMNGTTNYMLTRMAVDRKSYQEALAEAQRRGYAEADPTFDVSGKDAAQKLLLASRLAFNARLGMDDIYTEGIENISQEDMALAKKMGYAIKLLAYAGKEGDSIALRVYPALIPESSLLSRVDDVLNAVCVKAQYVGEQMFYGRGAGSLPTANAVVSDIVDVFRKRPDEAAGDPARFSMTPVEDKPMRYCLRFDIWNHKNFMEKVVESLAKEGIGIEALAGNDPISGYESTALVTSKILEKDVMAVLSGMASQRYIQGKPYAIRVADL